MKPILAACPLKPLCAKSRREVPLDMLNRREWVKRFVIGSAVALTGEAWNGKLLASISPATSPWNVISLKIADYPTLRDTPDGGYGSLRFNLFGTAIPNGIITVTRAPGNLFYTMSAYCTHQGSIVEAYDNSPGTEAMICYTHGSVYDIQGQVVSPAESSSQPALPAYNNDFANGVLRIEIPSLNFKVNTTTLFSTNGGTQRFQISFPAKNGAKYRIRYSPDLVTAPVVVPCATTSGGLATATLISQTSNATRNVWVDSTSASGFYFVEMVVALY
jgi:Rieske Fe-S protein